MGTERELIAQVLSNNSLSNEEKMAQIIKITEEEKKITKVVGFSGHQISCFANRIKILHSSPTSNSSSKQFNSKSSSSSRLYHDFINSTSPTNITDLFNFKLDQTLPQLKSSLEKKNIPLVISNLNVKNENEVITFCDPIFKCFQKHLPAQQNIGIYVE